MTAIVLSLIGAALLVAAIVRLLDANFQLRRELSRALVSRDAWQVNSQSMGQSYVAARANAERYQSALQAVVNLRTDKMANIGVRMYEAAASALSDR